MVQIVDDAMATEVTTTAHSPKWFYERMSTYWWLGRWPFLKFILREISSVFVALFVVLTLCHLRALANGPAAYAAFQDWLKQPWVTTLNLVSFFFVLFHAITWFNLTPQAMPLRLGGKRIPAVWLMAPNYFLWLAISAVLAWLILKE